MSELTKKAVWGVLSGDGELAALVGKDSGGNPAIFNANFNRANPAVFPCITFREADGSAFGGIRGETVDAEYFNIEVWAKTDSALTVPRIAERIDSLLHNKALSGTGGRIYDCARVAQAPDQYDDKLKLHFGLYRYRLVAGR
jgi:hypothetical protein